MRHCLHRTALFAAALCLGGCAAIQDAMDYGRGPFDQSPASGSEAALEGLHESSWGNSGKWGAKPAEEAEEVGEADTDQTADPYSAP